MYYYMFLQFSPEHYSVLKFNPMLMLSALVFCYVLQRFPRKSQVQVPDLTLCDLSGKSGILKYKACSNQVTKLKQKGIDRN